MPALDRREIDIRPCIDVWNAGLQPGKPPAENIAAYKPLLQDLPAKLKSLDANSARLFVEVCCCEDEMPWKSEKLWPGHGNDYLRFVTKALQEHGGYKVYFFSHAWMSPFQVRGRRHRCPTVAGTILTKAATASSTPTWPPSTR